MAANEERVRSISRIAGQDFTGANPGQYRFVVISANATVDGEGQIVPAGNVVLAGNGVRGLGVLRGKGRLGHAVEVALEGRVLVVLGATNTIGGAAQSDANGAAINQASTGCVMGIFLEAGVAGDVVSIDLAPQGAP